MLQLRDVRFGFPQRPEFLGPVSMEVRGGQCWAIVGPNGAGKSTLLRLMCGLHKPHGGGVLLEGTPLMRSSRRARAQRIAFVPQRPTVDFDVSARDIVLMGRFPHRALGLFDSAEDHRLAEEAMAQTSTLDYAERPLATLSGGEAQRVHIAAALAQEPRVLLLDEPTASLDLQHERSVFQLLRDAAGRGLAIVVVTHDLNLAADYCTDAMLLHEGKPVASGPPSEVLTPQQLEPVYGVRLASVAAPGNADRRWLIPAQTAAGGGRGT